MSRCIITVYQSNGFFNNNRIIKRLISLLRIMESMLITTSWGPAVARHRLVLLVKLMQLHTFTYLREAYSASYQLTQFQNPVLFLSIF